MIWATWKPLSIACAMSFALMTFGYAAVSPDVNVKLVSINVARLGEVADLRPRGVVTRDTPIFAVQFSTETDLIRLANQFDNYTVRASLLVGDACTPNSRVLSTSRVSEILIGFSEVYDDLGKVESRSDPRDASASVSKDRTYRFYFGVRAPALSEFLSTGLHEAPLCFVLRGGTYTGKSFSSNIVPLPPQVLAEAASRL